jgi:TRAP-type mannitol/chloroaromatic compound transport system permease large subunit
MADQLGRSVGDMYAGAFIPGHRFVRAFTQATFSEWRCCFLRQRRGLPPETQTLKDDDGKVHRISLAVVVAISAHRRLLRHATNERARRSPTL